jgi:hypothetical protein
MKKLSTPKNLAEENKKLTHAMKCTQEYWKKLNVNLVYDFNSSDAFPIRVHSKQGRSNSGNLYLADETPPPHANYSIPSENELCFTFTHELAHKMGIPDDYQVAGLNCPNREEHTQRGDSLMNGGHWGNQTDSNTGQTTFILRPMNEMRLYPDQFSQIFGKLCGPFPAN